MRRRLLCVVLVVIALVGVQSARAAGGTVSVYYAASMVNVNESGIGVLFGEHTGLTYQGKAAGSLALANQMKAGLIRPDVLEFADPAVNDLLTGPANGSYVSWYFTFARNELVIAYNPHSRYAAAFRAVKAGKAPWYTALLQHGLRLGRTDPALDPKGYRTIFMAHLAQRVYHLKGFEHRVLGDDRNSSQIFPEEVLAARLLVGEIDAGVFYLSEVHGLGMPYIRLPSAVNLGSVKERKLYATQSYTTPQGTVVHGAPILYTITIPAGAPNPAGAEAFVRFVLSAQGRKVERAFGLPGTRVVLHGPRSAVPATLTRYIGK